MKLIIAIIQPDKLDEVQAALMEAEITRITVSRVTGHGQALDPELYRGEEVVPGLLPRVRLEIGVNDAFVDTTVDAILRGARHGDGELGDGKIFILPMEDVIRIRTGERGGTSI